MRKLLTISIPTWNRAVLLDELLHELTLQISGNQLEDRIEILVSNNASSDHSHEVVNAYREKFNFISYNKNDHNIGGKLNVLKAMELAASDYVLFVGDDDRIRKDILPALLYTLKTKTDVGVLIDISRSKLCLTAKEGSLSVSELLEDYFWYMGNAGLFVVKTDYIRQGLNKYGYDFLNECWPQTQLMLLGLTSHPKDICYAVNLQIPAEGVHDEVMVYSSFYLWRTVVYDLRISIESIRHLISSAAYQAAMSNMKKSANQNFLNLLQCGVFIDDAEIKQKTIHHIQKNLNLFHGKEKLLYGSVAIILLLPSIISKSFSTIFIFFLKGNAGLRKKNNFVAQELMKKGRIHKASSGETRTLEFERND